MYFVLGMLSIIGAIALALIVWGIVKITKLLKTIKQQEEWITNNDRNYWDNTHRMREDLERRLDSMYQHADQHVAELQREMVQRINDQITDSVTATKSYTDSRIDKVIDTYFDTIGAKKSKKEIING